MSYFNYPRLHFSGRFKASPSTINNTPNNYDPTVYPSPNELQNVELYWNPKGDGGFAFVDCVVTRVDYADGTSSTTPEEDSIIGQPVASVRSPSFPLRGALVDLDPMQQNVSEIWAMMVQIGGASNLVGSFSAISFYAIWGQAQGQNAPHSSASGSGVYQSTLRNTQLNGGAGGSKFLQYFADNPTANLSINFNVNTHNNKPPMWRFNDDTFAAMRSAQPPVPDAVLAKIQPMQQLVQNLKTDGTPAGSPRGDVPTQDFVLFMLKQYLTTQEYNDNIDTILAKTVLPYTGSTSEDFLYGLTTGTIGPAAVDDPAFFVRNRMMNPQEGSPAWYAPFTVSKDEKTKRKTIQLNLGNSLPTELPGTTPWAGKLGTLSLVVFSPPVISFQNAREITKCPDAEIPYAAPTFINQQAGVYTEELNDDYDSCSLPLGLISVITSETGPAQSIILAAEDPQGYYLRANQFVFRLNPGIPSTPDFPRGQTATVEIHALQWGNPVPDGTQITVTMMNPDAAAIYTKNTAGTGGTNGIKNVSTPQDALKINGRSEKATASTIGGVARFELSCTPPGNPRGYVNGQVYFLNYGFFDSSIAKGYIQDPDDILSVLVYDEVAEREGPDILAKFGRLYKIMSFLTDRAKISQIDLRNMIKLLLERPFTEVTHMPVTRDIAEAERAKVISWINALNNS